MKKCSRCGRETWPGQAVCPACGKPLSGPRQVRCRYCGRKSPRSLVVCPGCGERLQAEWLRPVLTAVLAIGAVILSVLLINAVRRSLPVFEPAEIIDQIEALPSRLPVLVQVPSVTPSLTPSITPTPTRTPTLTPLPSLTPTPTLTPPPTDTPLPTATPTLTPTVPTATRTPTPRSSATPRPTVATATPLPSLAAPVPLEPEDGGNHAPNEQFRLAWSSDVVLQPDQWFHVSLNWTRLKAPDGRNIYVKDRYWFVDRQLYGLADQETDRAYTWTVRVVSQSIDAAGKEVYTPLSPPSVEWHFHWRE